MSASRHLVRFLLLVVTVTACSSGLSPNDPLDPAVRAEVDLLFGEPHFLSRGDFEIVAGSADRRIAWPLVDLLRFHQGGDRAGDLTAALETLTGARLGEDWVGFTDWLLHEEVPAPPGYLAWKRAIFLAVDESWEPFFDATPGPTGSKRGC
jgi:hypothetical protein